MMTTKIAIPTQRNQMNNEDFNLHFSATLTQDTPINDEEMSISFTALSNHPTIRREGAFGDYYISIDTDNVIWSAKNLFLDHNPTFNNSVGVIDEVKKDNKGFKVKVRFFEHIPLSKEAYERFKAGLSQSVSVGFGNAQIEEIGELNALPHYKIKGGEIVELSAVWMGADPKAKISSFAKTTQKEKEQNQGETMQEKQNEKQNEKEIQGETMFNQTQNKEAKDIAQLAEVLGQKDLGLQAILEGKSYEDFRSEVFMKSKENKSLALATNKGKSQGEFSLYNVITNRADGELEFVNNKTGRLKIPNTFYEKFESVITKSTNPEVASIEPLYYRGDKFIDLVRNSSPLLQKLDVLSGLISVQQIPRDNTELDAVFLDEGASADAQSLSFDNIKLTPKTLSNKVIITRRMFEMTPLSLESFVLQKMITGIRRKLEKVILYGTSPEPITGIFNTSGVQAMEGFMKAPDFKSALKFKGMLQSLDYDTSRCAFFVNAMGFTELEGTPKSINTTNVTTERTLLENNKMAGFDIYVNNLMNDGDIILGDFSNAILGIWSDGIEIKTYQLPGDNLVIEGFYDIDFALKRNNAFVISKIK